MAADYTDGLTPHEIAVQAQLDEMAVFSKRANQGIIDNTRGSNEVNSAAIFYDLTGMKDFQHMLSAEMPVASVIGFMLYWAFNTGRLAEREGFQPLTQRWSSIHAE